MKFLSTSIFLLISAYSFGFDAEDSDCSEFHHPSEGNNYVTSSETWYQYTAPEYELVRLTSVGYTTVDTKVSITFTCPEEGQTTSFFVNDDAFPGLKQSAIQFELQANQTVYFSWEGKNAAVNFGWYFEASPPEAGQICTNPLSVQLGVNEFEGDYWGQWFFFTVSQSGVYTVTSDNFSSSTGFLLYTNGCPSLGDGTGSSYSDFILEDFSIELEGGQSVFFRWFSYEYSEFTWFFDREACPIFYADSDGDGYGDPSSSLESCDEPEGFVSNNLDCDDDDDSVNPDLIWYVDVDNDGFGSSSQTQQSCLQPQGFVSNSDDCDDLRVDLTTEKMWYIDSDDDGYGSDSQTLFQCEQPQGYVPNSDDCNDEDSFINPDLIWYKDEDGDGFGSKVILRNCTQPDGYVSNSDDCDDDDAKLTTIRIWYADSDGDGFGNSNFSLSSCTRPVGYTSEAGDCDDNDSAVYPDAPPLADGKDNDCDGDVDKLSQQIEFEPLADQVDNDAVIILEAKSSSGLPLEYRVEGPARYIGNNQIELMGAGPLAITAKQPGNEGYLAAEPITIGLCVDPDPIIEFTQDENSNIVLTSGYASNNQWFRNGEKLDEEQDATLDVTREGSYTVEVNTGNCVGLSQPYTILLTSLEEQSEKLKIYPNPATQQLFLEVAGLASESIDISLMDLRGQLVHSESINTSGSLKIQIDVKSFAKGTYLIVIESQDSLMIQKFVKE